MSCDIVIGGQWGDEGKAKMVDYLAQHYNVVCRYQGGGNAGHTVKHDGKKYVFHLLPSGVLHPTVTCVLGSGMVVDLTLLLKELDSVESQGISMQGRLKISSRAILVLDYHILIDQLREAKNNRLGTTGRGIGPAYSDKINRIGIRVGDLYSEKILKEKIELSLEEKNVLLNDYFKAEKKIEVAEIIEKLKNQFARIKDYIVDSAVYLNHETLVNDVLLEGAQGTGLDIDFGSYPYVTSSSTTSGGALTGTGVSMKKINNIYGVFKAYITRVGGGGLPTALEIEEMKILREKGEEFGATTGRERGCGWFDGVQAKFAVMTNGLTGIALTKLDILTGYKKIKFCTHYEIDGQHTMDFPDRIEDFEKAIPIYKEFDGWGEDMYGMTSYNQIPSNAKKYLDFLQEYLACPVKFLSTGPERNQTINF